MITGRAKQNQLCGMAHLSAQGRLKPLLNSDGISFGYETKDLHPHHHHKAVLGCGDGDGGGGVKFTLLPSINQAQLHGRCSTRVYASKNSSSSSSASHHKSKRLSKKEERVGDGVVEEIIREEFEKDELASFRGLVLDISYRPVNVVCWKRAICLEFTEKADVLEYYDQTVNSPRGSFYIPAVLRVPHLLQVVKRRRIKSTLSRKNILYRDNFTCQYCPSGENLTIDHVIPISRGGEWTWENLVIACAECNNKKGQKTLEEANMKLKKVPRAPKDYDILAIPLTSTAIKMLRMRNGTPEEWRQYLSKPAP